MHDSPSPSYQRTVQQIWDLVLLIGLLVVVAACRRQDDTDEVPPERSVPEAKTRTDTSRPEARGESQATLRGGQQRPKPTFPSCPAYAAVKSTGRVAAPALTELSGLAPSLRHPGVFYTHNDSGDEERIYAINEKGELLATFRLGRKRAIDVEDIALVELDGKAWIYVADVGDNKGERAQGIRIDRFQEPSSLPSVGTPNGTSTEQIIADFGSISLTYPNGPQDAEALVVDPRTGAIVIITKVLGDWASIFVRADFSTGELGYVGQMTPQRTGHAVQYVTAADVSRTGEFVGVRTYSYAYLFRRGPNQSLAQALMNPACLVPTGSEIQGEALALFSREGEELPSFLTISEGESPELFVTEAVGKHLDPSQSK